MLNVIHPQHSTLKAFLHPSFEEGLSEWLTCSSLKVRGNRDETILRVADNAELRDTTGGSVIERWSCCVRWILHPWSGAYPESTDEGGSSCLGDMNEPPRFGSGLCLC